MQNNKRTEFYVKLFDYHLVLWYLLIEAGTNKKRGIPCKAKLNI